MVGEAIAWRMRPSASSWVPSSVANSGDPPLPRGKNARERIPNHATETARLHGVSFLGLIRQAASGKR